MGVISVAQFIRGCYGFFSKKNILIPNVAEKKYSDFGGGKKK
jgi:hypothetical protein